MFRVAGGSIYSNFLVERRLRKGSRGYRRRRAGEEKQALKVSELRKREKIMEYQEKQIKYSKGEGIK